MAHNSWRFFDRLRLGSVTNRTGFGLPDPGFVRGPTYVNCLPMRSTKPTTKWVMAAVALLMIEAA